MSNKKEVILEKATGLFADFGYEGTSTREIAKQANVNLAMLSYYFGSKEQLLIEIIRRHLKLLNEIFCSDLSDITDPWDAFHQKIVSLVDFCFENPSVPKILHRELTLRKWDHLIDTYIELYSPLKSSIMRILTEELMLDAITPEAMDVFESMIFGTLITVIMVEPFDRKSYSSEFPGYEFSRSKRKEATIDILWSSLSNYLKSKIKVA